VFDTLEASRRQHGRDVLGGHGLGAVVARELALQLDKTAQTSHWARRPLSPEQLAYAAADVEVLIHLDRKLRVLLPLSPADVPGGACSSTTSSTSRNSGSSELTWPASATSRRGLPSFASSTRGCGLSRRASLAG
jgi:ribonuclease D